MTLQESEMNKNTVVLVIELSLLMTLKTFSVMSYTVSYFISATKYPMEKGYVRCNITLLNDFDNLFFAKSMPVLPLSFRFISFKTSFIELLYVSSSIVSSILSGEGTFHA